ncbi:MAG: alpha/beta fold hydrolase [Chloroflexota bacterium]|nr:alpha/beta fold hydrolase [Chloroflexota bacterium]
MIDFIKNLRDKKKSIKVEGIGKEENWEWQGHRITYSVLGNGLPLLAVHGFNASAGAFELRNNLEPLATKYRVYAPDLPGFGRSERKPISYTAELYIQFFIDFALYITQLEQQAPAVFANSLAAAHIIGAVARRPEAFGPLLLSCPTGLERLMDPPGKKALLVNRVLRGPIGAVVFRLLTSRSSTRLFLGRDGYYDPNYVDEALVERYYQSARQPNARFAPVAFITFGLNHSVKEEWPNIKQPVLLVWGRDANLTPLSNAAAFLKERPDTQLHIIDHVRLSLYDERAEEFNALALDWFGRNYQQKNRPTLVSSGTGG